MRDDVLMPGKVVKMKDSIHLEEWMLSHILESTESFLWLLYVLFYRPIGHYEENYANSFDFQQLFFF
jgi:hypothetical protein